MSTVLLEDETVRATVEEIEAAEKIAVPVTLVLENDSIVFAPGSKPGEYGITSHQITLLGDGNPRQFLLRFSLSDTMIQGRWTFDNPALQLFQGSGKKAGILFPPEASAIEANLSVFNLMTSGDPKIEDRFNIILLSPSGKVIHDPTIVWDLPGGG